MPSRRRSTEAQAEAPARQWGEAGSIRISSAAVQAERSIRITAAADSAATGRVETKTATGTAAEILRNAAQSLLAQANVDRYGAVDLLLK